MSKNVQRICFHSACWPLSEYSDRKLGTRLMLGSLWQCKTLIYLSYCAESSSQWLFVLFTFNRLLAISSPIRARVLMTDRVTVLTISMRARLRTFQNGSVRFSSLIFLDFSVSLERLHIWINIYSLCTFSKATECLFIRSDNLRINFLL